MRESSIDASTVHRMARGLVFAAIFASAGALCSCKSPCDKLIERMEAFEGDLKSLTDKSTKERLTVLQAHIVEVERMELPEDAPRKRYLGSLKNLVEGYERILRDEKFKQESGLEPSAVKERDDLVRVYAENVAASRRYVIKRCNE